jgi:transposase
MMPAWCRGKFGLTGMPLLCPSGKETCGDLVVSCGFGSRARQPPQGALIALIERAAMTSSWPRDWPSMRPNLRCALTTRLKAANGVADNLLLRLAERRQDVLRFLANPNVPFTNNEAERDERMMKVKQQISGGFRSLEGAMDFAAIRSFISTAKKQGWSLIQALTQDLQILTSALRAG